jgi:predicted phosphodiesterase
MSRAGARYGVIADVHANMEALEAVMAFLSKQNLTKVVCLGDIVGYNASPRECVKLIREKGVECISGNHERLLLGVYPAEFSIRKETLDSIAWSKAQLSDDDCAFLLDLPKEKVVDNRFLMVHGSPRNEDEYILEPASMMENLASMTNYHPHLDVCFFGHTHMPMFLTRGTVFTDISGDRTFEVMPRKAHLVNPGSVGQPRDGYRKASCCVFDSGDMTVTFHRIEYDIESAQRRIIDAKLDVRLANRIGLGK